MSYFRTVTYEISATCAPEAEVEWAIHGPDVEEPNVRILHVGEVTDERPAEATAACRHCGSLIVPARDGVWIASGRSACAGSLRGHEAV